jgi:hypothetical protein
MGKKNDLVKRWNTKEGKAMLSNIINVLEKGGALDSINGLQQIDGRWDLRGATLSTLKSENVLKIDQYKYSQKRGSLRLRNVVIQSIDFSFGDVSYSVFEKCTFTDCVFREVNGPGLKVIASDFEACEFIKCNFQYSFMNENIGSNSGQYRNVQFIETDLTECVFYFPIIDNCVFANCDLRATNFDGSRFSDTKFIGKIDSSWFHGHSILAHKTMLGLFNRIQPLDFPNKMLRVDFTEAELSGVTFAHSIDLSACIFPANSERYLLIENLSDVYQAAKDIIVREWKGEDERKGISFIDQILFQGSHQKQKIDLVDKDLLTDGNADVVFGEKLFLLLSGLNMRFKRRKDR